MIASNEIPADRRVDFDTTVSAMALTAKEMNTKYKETSEGGLAVSVVLFLKRMGVPVPALPFLLLAGAQGAQDGVFALMALTGLKNHWRAVWPTLAPADSAPVRV